VIEKDEKMGKHKISAKKPMFGNARSFSMRATRRKFNPNMQNKRIYVPEIGRHVRVQVSVGELRTIDKIGFIAFLKRRGIPLHKLID
jgi:large subunit ribosomal protein L28